MKVSVIIVGIGEWEKYTRPLILSIQRYEPKVDITVVDNGNLYTQVLTPTMHLTGDIRSYAEAINSSGLWFYDLPLLHGNWYLIMNNDVICEAPFVDYLETLQEDTIYGNKLHHFHKLFEPPCPWIDGWIYAIPRNILESVGKWDENFEIAGFEDADYCFRAHKLGLNIDKSKLPFVHLERHIRREFKDYPKHRKDNIDYLMRKHELKQI